jgi:hypothetical protein
MQVQQAKYDSRRGMLRITPFEFAKMVTNAQGLDDWASRQNKNRSRQIFWSSVCGILVLAMSPIPFWIKYELGPNDLFGAWTFASLLCVFIVCLFVFINALLTRMQEVDYVNCLTSSVIALPSYNSARKLDEEN